MGMAKRMKEGRRLKLDAFTAIIPYIMVERCDAANHFTMSFDCQASEALIRKLRSEGYESIGILHIILAAYVRTVSQRPKINRFIRGQKIYARNGIVVNMVVKRHMRLEERDTSIKMVFDPSDSLYDVYEKVNKELADVYSDNSTSLDKTADLINYIPGLIKKFTIFCFKALDYFGLLPKALINVSPFHGSMYITNIASLNLPPVTHHLYNFGNVPIFIAFGAKRWVMELNEDGSVNKRRVIDIVFNLDERICDGYYYASAVKVLKKCLSNPEALLEKPEEVVIDNG